MAPGLWCLAGPTRSAAAPVTLDGKLDDWQGTAPAFIYITPRASGSYGRIQARRGSDRVENADEIGCSDLYPLGP